jgi:uncharacterized cupredoxin-like copper-binding protein
MQYRNHITSVATAMVLMVLGTSQASSHGDESHAKKVAGQSAQLAQVETAFGKTGDPKRVSRTIRVGMHDSMRFSPKDITIRRGDTALFIARNDGKIMHEMVLGTMAELKQHGELMKKFPEMEHDEPYMAHVKPGNTEEIVWQFTQAGAFYYACLIPGHFEAGMIGKIVVR